VNDLERFESHVAYVGECWIWQRATSGSDRKTAVFSVGGKMCSAQRWIYAQVYGPVPAGRAVQNRCGNMGCVNPAHHGLSTSAKKKNYRKLPPLQGPPRPKPQEMTPEERVARKSLSYTLRLERRGSKCKDCGRAVTPQATRCRDCWDRERTKVFSRSPEARLRNYYRAWKFRRTGVAS
jgi:hypothetical protein